MTRNLRQNQFFFKANIFFIQKAASKILGSEINNTSLIPKMLVKFTPMADHIKLFFFDNE
jgi:hypothetical protein